MTSVKSIHVKQPKGNVRIYDTRLVAEQKLFFLNSILAAKLASGMLSPLPLLQQPREKEMAL